MIKKVSRNEMRKVRHARIRENLSGTSERPRLCVFRSNANIEAQIIDDVKGYLFFFNVLLLTSTESECCEKKRYQEKVEECNIALQQLYIDKAAGIITPKAYVELSSTFQTDKSRYEIIITSCDEQIREVDSYLRLSDNHSELLAPYVKVEQLNRRMVETLIDRIEIGKRNRETGLVPVSIFWNF